MCVNVTFTVREECSLYIQKVVFDTDKKKVTDGLKQTHKYDS